MRKYVNIDPKAIEAGADVHEEVFQVQPTDLGFAINSSSLLWATVIEGLILAGKQNVMEASTYALLAKALQETLEEESND